MPEILKKIWQRIVEFWGNLNKSQKIRLIASISIVVIALVVSLVVVSMPKYVELVNSDDQKQLKSITDTLTEEEIDFKMSDDKKSVLVNAKDKSRAQVATLGFVKNGMEFEDAFNMIKLNTTEGDKEKLWAEYKKKNLGYKLEAIANNIEVADVDLDIPETSPFVDSEEETRKPTARVIVKPKDKLTERQVEGIASMVAGSVAGLNVKDVVVLDDNLNVLNKNSSDDAINNLSNQEELRLQKAKELEERVYKLLGESSDSFDGIKVVANPVLNFDKQKSVTKDIKVPEGMDVTAGKGVIISESSSSENAKENPAAQPPGTDTNPGNTTTYQTGDQGAGSYKKENNDINYGYTKTDTEQEKATGAMVKEESSMALALYYGRNVTNDKKLSRTFINNMIDGVSRATGIPDTNISINKFKMAPLKVQKKTASETAKSLIDDYGMFAIMAILAIGLFVSLFPRKKKEVVVEEIPIREPTQDLDDSDEDQLLDIDLEEKSEVKKQIDKFVKQRPDAVAQLLRNWLSDEWD